MGADVNKINSFSGRHTSAFEFAVTNKHLAVVEALLKAGTVVDVVKLNKILFKSGAVVDVEFSKELQKLLDLHTPKNVGSQQAGKAVVKDKCQGLFSKK